MRIFSVQIIFTTVARLRYRTGPTSFQVPVGGARAGTKASPKIFRLLRSVCLQKSRRPTKAARFLWFGLKSPPLLRLFCSQAWAHLLSLEDRKGRCWHDAKISPTPQTKGNHWACKLFILPHHITISVLFFVYSHSILFTSQLSQREREREMWRYWE